MGTRKRPSNNFYPVDKSAVRAAAARRDFIKKQAEEAERRPYPYGGVQVYSTHNPYQAYPTHDTEVNELIQLADGTRIARNVKHTR